MILSTVEIAPRTAGLATVVTHHVLLTTILMNRVSSEPLILTGIYLARKSPTMPLTLQTRYDSVQSLTSELLTSSLTEKSHRLERLGLGVLMMGLISIAITCILALPKRAIQMVRSLISR